jgi:cell division protein FtsI (penicillin-binding protein 3)
MDRGEAVRIELHEPILLWRYQRFAGTFVLVAICLGMAGLGGRLVYINSVMSPKLKAIAAQQQAGRRVIPARRGMIMDRRGRVVATTRQEPDVFVDPKEILKRGDEQVDAVAAELAARLNLDAAKLAEQIRERPNRRYLLVARGVDEIDADSIRTLGFGGVGITLEPRRRYPLGASMAHVLGFVGRDGDGLAGVEYAWNAHLRARMAPGGRFAMPGADRCGRRRTVSSCRRMAGMSC